jgi:hypothetical protein
VGELDAGTILALAEDLNEKALRADPLAHWRPSSWVQRAMLSCWLEHPELIETYWHAANSGGKTDGLASLTLAMLQRRPSLAGIALPEMPKQVFGVLLVHSYKQAVLSSIKALREKLGDWDHHEVPASDDCPGVIYVRQVDNKSQERETWSRLYVYPRDGEVPDGLRLDLAWGDEPPDDEMWRELRHRATAGRRFFRFIGATPKLKRFWGWLLADYERAAGKEPGREGTWHGAIRNGRLRLQSSIYDNKALSAADIRRAEIDAENDPEKDARLFGMHVDSSGSNPWTYATLARWKARCVEPEVEMLEYQGEIDGGAGRRLEPRMVRLQVVDPPDFLDSYYIPIDPAKGIRDSKHDPDGIHVWSIRHNKLVARVNDYVGAFNAGVIGAILAKRYNNALVDVAMTGGYGEAVLTGLRVSGYWNINRQKYWDREQGAWASRLGYVEDEQFRGKIIGAIDRAIQTDSCVITIPDVIDSLIGCVVDENGRIVADTKNHDEDLVLAGAAQLFIGGQSAQVRIAEAPNLDIYEAVARSQGRRPDAPLPEPVIHEAW